MFRLRRYRIFLIVAALTTLTVYRLSQSRSWEASQLDGLATFGFKANLATSKPNVVYPLPTSSSTTEPRVQKPLLKPTSSPSPLPSSPQQKEHEITIQTSSTTIAHVLASSTSDPLAYPTLPYDNHLGIVEEFDESFGQVGQGRLDVPPRPTDQPRASWVSQKQQFPIATDEIRAVPSNTTPLPKIQYKFEPETESARVKRVQRLEAIKEAFKHAWTGYETYAMPNDELKPYSKSFSNPFNGWGATLVDSLDTLWIMGMTEEFGKAVDQVSKINFKTTSRKDIPVFETVIRYLGGLLSAYDLTSPKYPVLLDKAKELAEILIGAFDTPNRMPITYYHWAPSYASQAHRASVRVVLAEIGSLAVEFTRLSQLTSEPKYYDAISRITDALELWQMNTTIPGMWPNRLDASGCKKPQLASSAIDQSFIGDSGDLTWVPVSSDGPLEVSEPVQFSKIGEAAGDSHKTTQPLGKRQADDAAFSTSQDTTDALEDLKPPPKEKNTKLAAPVKIYGTTADDVDCETQGLSHEPNAPFHHYSIGAQADSTYEYLPKEYMLLGGAAQQYQSMYKKAMKPVREKLIYRPMTKQARDVLFVAKASLDTNRPDKLKLTYEGTHLGCFAGGMFALGSRVFDIKDDLEIARKLTEGCIWAYGSTPTGIMPEEFYLAPCKSLTSCTWNQTRYYELLDPGQQQRIDTAELWNENRKKAYDEALAIAKDAAEQVEILRSQRKAEAAAIPSSIDGPSTGANIAKRQIGYSEPAGTDDTSVRGGSDQPTKTIDDVPEPEPAASMAPAFTPMIPVPHEEFVEARILEERLPNGFTQILSRQYKLRPEAIESVFIMYRLTGEERWQEEGWKMFKAVETHTRTIYAHSALVDVTSKVPGVTDTMESFWLAETLKYFYLLFSDPDVISLDDYVLNTEAHPFRIPK